MNCNKLFVSWVVALSVLAGGAGRPLAAATYPSMRLPYSFSGLRMVQYSATATGANQWITVGPAQQPGSFTLDGGTALAVSSTATSATPGTSVPFNFDWAAGVPVGPASGTITLTDWSNPNDYGNHTMTVTGAVLANRILTVAPLGESAPVRTVLGSTLTTTLSSGDVPQVDGDNFATRVNMVRGGQATDGAVTVGYQVSAGFGHWGLMPTQFNAPGQSVKLNVVVPLSLAPGAYSNTFDLAPYLLSDGEAPAVGATVQPAYFTYSLDALQNRTLTVGALPSTRVLVNTPIATTISTGINDPDDSSATEVAIVPSGIAKSGDVTVKYNAPTVPVFNGPGLSDNLTVTFSSTGLHEGGLNLAPKLLANGEAPSVGATVQPAVLNYSGVAVLARRQLSVVGGPVTFNNVLKGSYVATTLLSTNATGTDSNHATSVAVAQGGAAVGGVMVQATTVSSGVATVYGQLTQYNTGSSTVSGTVPVQTAELPAVGDTKPYSPLTFKYSAGDVGIATIGSSAAIPPTQTKFGPTLSGLVPKGFTLGSFTPSTSGSATYVSLSSKVAPSGTLAGGSTNIYGPVGSAAEILDSTTLGANTTVSMAWRQRNAYESGNSSVAPPGGALPTGTRWLTSDVVKLGISPAAASASPMVYAMQMSFDNGINGQLDNGASALQEFNNNSLYLAQLIPASGMNPGGWENAVLGDTLTAGINAKTHVNDSLADFLNQKLAGLTGSAADAMLRTLVGSWGVDTTNDEAWAIIDHAGTMAVVPEPATVLLLLSAGGVMLWYRRRRR